MTAPRRKPSFASLLRRASRRDEPEADGASGFYVDPDRVRLWGALAAPSAEECADNVDHIARNGQTEPVTVRPVFDDNHFEYEVIAGARAWVAVRHLRETAMPDLGLLVRVELVDDAAAVDLATPAPVAEVEPDLIAAAFGAETVPADYADDLAARLEGPFAPVILATAVQIARAQVARRGDGLPLYPAAEVKRLFDAVSTEPPHAAVSLSIVDASASGVTFSLAAADDMPPEMLARIVKAMIDGAAADGIAVGWATGPSAATSP